MLKSKDEIGTSYILFMVRKSVHVVFRLSLCLAMIGSPQVATLRERPSVNIWVVTDDIRLNHLVQEHNNVTPA